MFEGVLADVEHGVDVGVEGLDPLVSAGVISGREEEAVEE